MYFFVIILPSENMGLLTHNIDSKNRDSLNREKLNINVWHICCRNQTNSELNIVSKNLMEIEGYLEVAQSI